MCPSTLVASASRKAVSMPEMHKKRDPGIKGYDPNSKKPPIKQLECPHCWFTHRSQSVLTKHINDEHWDKV